MKVIDPGPDVLLGICQDCHTKTRLFELCAGHFVCLECLRDIVLEAIDEADADAAP